jgi:hypothetical protein
MPWLAAGVSEPKHAENQLENLLEVSEHGEAKLMEQPKT